MDINKKKSIAFRMTSRASTGLAFIDEFLDTHDKTDMAYLRTLYMILSHNFELILKSRVVMLSEVLTLTNLDKKLKGLSHNFIKISQELGNDELKSLGIKNIILDNKNILYTVRMLNCSNLYIEDFNNIRYNFINDKIRTINDDEYEKIKFYVNTINNILVKVKGINTKIK